MKSAHASLVASVVCLPLVLAGACAKESDPGGGTGGSGTTGGRGGSGSGGRGGTTGGSNTGSGGSGTGGASSGSGGSGGSGSGGTSAGGSGGTGGSGSGGSMGAGGSGGSMGGTGGTGAGGSAPAPAAMARPFPAHTMYKGTVVKPMGPQAQLDQATSNFYNQWKARYLKTGCGGRYVDPGKVEGIGEAPSMTISEAHGYGMVITAMMHGHDPMAKELFDGLHAYAKRFESVNKTGLMAWIVMANCMFSTAVTGNLVPDSAADGDLDMAYGYLLAHHQWGSSGAINYFEEARKIIDALKKHEINPETSLIMLGDWADVKADYYMARYGNGFLGPYKTTMRSHREFYYGTRSSDFMLGHFRAFGPATGDTAWNTTILDKHYELIARIQSMYSMASGLLPDFIESTNTGAKPAGPDYLEYINDDKYAYNACRFPWRLASDYVISGDARAKTALDKINNFIRTNAGGNAEGIKAGYRLNGTVNGNYYELAFVAPFGVAALADTANPTWVDSIWKNMTSQQLGVYYGDSIKMISMLVMSGNWWSP
jgi:endoglucanase